MLIHNVYSNKNTTYHAYQLFNYRLLRLICRLGLVWFLNRFLHMWRWLFCSLSFCSFFSDHLKIHMKTHDSRKPYKCGTCNRGYNTAAALSSHQQSHLKQESRSGSRTSGGSTPSPGLFRCSHCTESFGKPDLLQVRTQHAMKKHWNIAVHFRRVSPIRKIIIYRVEKKSLHYISELLIFGYSTIFNFDNIHRYVNWQGEFKLLNNTTDSNKLLMCSWEIYIIFWVSIAQLFYFKYNKHVTVWAFRNVENKNTLEWKLIWHCQSQWESTYKKLCLNRLVALLISCSVIFCLPNLH